MNPTMPATRAQATADPWRNDQTVRGSVSIVFPCLNEEKAIGSSIRHALAALASVALPGEVLVVDNASTDTSVEIACAAGARVVSEPVRGYGNALRRGLVEAEGEFVVLLDADGTYPVELVGAFVEALKDGADMVIGNRFAGQMERNAMPFLNRFVGNPILSGLTRALFGVPLRDIHCGMRAIRKDRIPALRLATPGMEFATEMIVKALDLGMRVKEIPIPYRPRVGDSKLSPMRDAWRHMEYMLVFCPGMLFLWPGLFLLLAGLAIQLLLISGPRPLFFHTWNVHTNLAGLAMSLCGTTLLVLGWIGANYAAAIGMRFRHSASARLVAKVEDHPLRGVGLLLTLLGGGLWLWIAGSWVASDFGALAAVPQLSLATSLLASGVEVFGAAFIIRVVRLARLG